MEIFRKGFFDSNDKDESQGTRNRLRGQVIRDRGRHASVDSSTSSRYSFGDKSGCHSNVDNRERGYGPKDSHRPVSTRPQIEGDIFRLSNEARSWIPDRQDDRVYQGSDLRMNQTLSPETMLDERLARSAGRTNETAGNGGGSYLRNAFDAASRRISRVFGDHNQDNDSLTGRGRSLERSNPTPDMRAPALTQ